MKNRIEVSVVIVSYNTRRLTLECIKSIYRESTQFGFEVIVVDNASTDGSDQALKKLSQKYHFRILYLNKNIGFGPANNQGARIATGNYLLFINPDTVLKENAIKISLDEAKNIPNLGVYSCRLSNRDGSIQPTGGYFPTLIRILDWQFFIDDLPILNRFLEPVHPKARLYQDYFEPDWLTGAFMLIPTRVFKKVGGFDPNIFMYVEDTDLCYRIKRKKYKIVYSPQTQITHFGGASSGGGLKAEAFQTVVFLEKHHSKLQATIGKVLIKLGSLLRWVLFGIIFVDEAKAKTYRELVSW